MPWQWLELFKSVLLSEFRVHEGKKSLVSGKAR